MNWTEIVTALIAALLPVVVSLLGYGAKKLADLINAKIANEEVAGILTRLDTITVNVVKELMQTSVDAAKAKAEGGGLPKEVAEAAGKAALDKVKSYLGQPGLDLLKAVLGFKDEATLNNFLTTKIEATVHNVKAQSDVATGTASAAAALTAAFGISK